MAHLPPIGWVELATRQDHEAALAELKGEFAELRGDFRSLLPKLVAANIGSMAGVAGVVLGAATLLR
jgi:hypothetical protein